MIWVIGFDAPGEPDFCPTAVVKLYETGLVIPFASRFFGVMLTLTCSPGEKGWSGLKMTVFSSPARMVWPVWLPLCAPWTLNAMLFTSELCRVGP